MNKKKQLLIFYDWFYPGFRAGGPIQSLTNLTLALTPSFEIYVITGAKDLNANAFYDSVQINTWNDIVIPGSAEAIKVFYAEKGKINRALLNQFFAAIQPDAVYLNGIFSYEFFLMPLLTLPKLDANFKVVVCPRGMLKEGALSNKALKKKIYLRFLKHKGLLKRVHWHATTWEESLEIKKHFTARKGVLVAHNIPKKPYINVPFIAKNAGELKLVYLSLINEHKNLLLLLQLISQFDSKVSLDIYGPVVDEAYWKKCQALIELMPEKVKYKGVVEPAKVQSVLVQYHTFILFTKGENFGHAIYESLSVGRPVVTSHFTPWQNLSQGNAGVNVDFENVEHTREKIDFFMQMQQNEYNVFCSSALNLATTYYSNLNAEEKYNKLFG